MKKQCAWCGLNEQELRGASAPEVEGSVLVKSDRGDFMHCFYPGCLEEENGANEMEEKP